MIFSDEIINHILSFRERHILCKILGPILAEYEAMEDGHNILEYYNDTDTESYYICSFTEWYFLYRRLI